MAGRQELNHPNQLRILARLEGRCVLDDAPQAGNHFLDLICVLRKRLTVGPKEIVLLSLSIDDATLKLVGLTHLERSPRICEELGDLALQDILS